MQLSRERCEEFAELITSGNLLVGCPYLYQRTLEPVHNKGDDEYPNWCFRCEVEESVSLIDYLLVI